MLRMYLSIVNGGVKRLLQVVVVVAVLILVVQVFLSMWDRDSLKGDSVSAQKSSVESLYASFNTTNYETKQGQQLAQFEKKTTCLLFGELCSEKPEESFENFQKSLTGRGAQVLVLPLAYKPASGVDYIATSLNEAGFIPQTYAQGIGFASLRPYNELWQAFRNVSYLILVLVLVVVGFMIMFQFRLNPQTVIGIESTLPRIILALLMITFSYAIAGLLIDLTYFIIYLIFEIFGSSGALNGNASDLADKYLLSSLGSTDAFSAGASGFSIYYHAMESLYGIVPFFIRAAIETVVTIAGVYFLIGQSDKVKSLFMSASGDLEVGGFGILTIAVIEIIAVVLAVILGRITL